MPPSSAKRPQRTRRDTRKDTSPVRPEEPSPSRPAKRRKKVQDTPPAEPTEDEDSSLMADRSGAPLDEDQLLSQVIQQLVFPKEGPVQASKDHANSIHEANQDGVKAYAKIAALDWTFYVTKLNVNIGRAPEPAAAPSNANEEDPDGDDFVHIDLGPSKTVSRQHARIFFNSEDEAWCLEVKGRNGVKVNNSPLKQGTLRALQSGEVLDVGGTEMMFVLPTEISGLSIHPTYLKRAGLSKQDLTSPITSATAAAPSDEPSSSGPAAVAGSSSRAPQPFRQPIAPAPPDYKRPGTPPSARSKALSQQHKSPGYPSSGTLLLNSNDVDLSHDDNKHIKPQFSYAQMITQAIINTSDGKLNLNGIYNFITTNYAYYRHQPAAGWQNSIRHNLSLNKSFDKVARSTDEPGKGMKWQIVPEAREEMTRTAYRGGRGGHRGSSAPSSPSQLNYINHGPGDVAAAREPGSARKRRLPTIMSPSATTSSLQAAQSTPDRGSSRHHPHHQHANMASTADGSPLPRARRGAGAAATAGTGTGTAPPSSNYSSNLQEQESPTLTSSILQDEGNSFVTPAPLRVHPRLAPPSTAQRPSQHMPTSSPAPFWKYADIGSTPLKPGPHFDLSPSKPAASSARASAAAPVLPPPSSSPPPHAKSPLPSPSRRKRELRRLDADAETEAEAEPEAEAEAEAEADADNTTPAPEGPGGPPEAEEEEGFDLVKGFQSIGSYHAPVSRGLSIAHAVNGNQT